MMIEILYAGNADSWDEYSAALKSSFDAVGLKYNLTNEAQAPESVDYIVYAPNGPLTDFTPFQNTKLVQSLWAGVEVPTANKTLNQPLARMVEPGLTLGMADYVLGHVLRHHLGTDFFATAKPGEWHEGKVPPLAADRVVGVLGLGSLGMFCAGKLAEFGFPTCGWSRSPKAHSNVKCYHGDDGLISVLERSEILVLLLPNTAQTTGVINAGSIANMRDGVAIINPGRGPLIDDDALLAALDSGKVSGATLDVFNVEPLPVDHRYWTHPSVLVTPHIASATRTKTACDVVAQNILRGENGEPYLHLVDKAAGY
jgi:glyoxylate/hydroxypyruvate reductase A